MKSLIAVLALACAAAAGAQTNSQDVARMADKLVQIDKDQRERAARTAPVAAEERAPLAPWTWLLVPAAFGLALLVKRKK